jgi:cytochrome c oxidase subunit 4
MSRTMTEIRKLGLTYAALLALLMLTVGSSFLDLGGVNSLLNLGIAGLKAGLIIVVFMHVGEPGALPPLAVAAVGGWLAILFGLTLIS